MLRIFSFQLHWHLSSLKYCEVDITTGTTIHVKSIAGLDLYEADLSPDAILHFMDGLNKIALETWQRTYSPEGFAVADGFMWNIEYEKTFIRTKETETIKITGSNAYPWCFYQLIQLIMDVAPNTKPILKEFANPVECFYFDIHE